jgi:hypothetical protein
MTVCPFPGTIHAIYSLLAPATLPIFLFLQDAKLDPISGILQVPFYVLGIVLILFFIFLPILAIQKDII